MPVIVTNWVIANALRSWISFFHLAHENEAEEKKNYFNIDDVDG